MLTRQIGMGDNPINYAEINAYCCLTGIRMEPWEAKALIELYWTYRSAVSVKGQGGVRNETDARDGAGVKALMSGFVRQQQADKGGKAAR